MGLDGIRCGHSVNVEILGNGSCKENVEETNNIPRFSDCGRIGGNGHEKEMHQTSYFDLANLDFDTTPDGPISFLSPWI